MSGVTPDPWQVQAGRVIVARLLDEGYLDRCLIASSTAVDKLAATMASIIVSEEKRHSQLKLEGSGG